MPKPHKPLTDQGLEEAQTQSSQEETSPITKTTGSTILYK